ncbi:hybrid sensor histidine kinase/response regulator [Palleniella muris]|uniref:Hybrid sensor histidine kinase/response regulator n=1 Tax=Palleniella muris TaxID=3038145 RepID=A0AC61QS92_9BACT|nr:response regulator [Palleniella muris]TGX83316.1 hybrid sensor histidine kinase/response regulator [Palleniella muris]
MSETNSLPNRMPLTIIQAAIDRILSAGVPPAKFHEPISNMAQSVKRMRRLTDQLLLFRKMQAGKLSVAVQPTDLPQFLKNIFLTFHEVAEQRKITAEFLPQSRHFHVPVDHDYIDKAVYNLLSNAFKYTPSGGIVTMKVKQNEQDSTVAIIVEDSGCGISKEKQKHLFDRYVTGKISSDSIGIGLNLTASLIEAHHGSISYCERNGGGSVFTLTIPANEDAYSQSERLQASAIQIQTSSAERNNTSLYKAMRAQPLNSQRILIVEDDNDVALLVQQEINELFYTDIASNASEALRKMESESYDLVITDMTMPKMSGLAMAKHIRQGVHNPHVPIIILTGKIDDDLKTKALLTGINVFMTKPFNAEQLRAHCVNLVKSSSSLVQPPSVQTERVISDNRQARFLSQLNQAIDAHIDDTTLNVDTLTEILKVSRSALNTKVRTLTGLSPAELIRSKRISQAKHLLRETDMSIGEIGNKVGMPSPQSFNATFKKITGLSPSEFRKGGVA